MRNKTQFAHCFRAVQRNTVVEIMNYVKKMGLIEGGFNRGRHGDNVKRFRRMCEP